MEPTSVEITPRKIDVKPAFELTLPGFSEDLVMTMLKIDEAGVKNADAKSLAEAQTNRIEALFKKVSYEEPGGKSLFDRLTSSITAQLEDPNVVLEAKRDLLSDLNKLENIHLKVEGWTDPLTGLYNRRGFVELIKLIAKDPKIVFGDNSQNITEKHVSIMLMDIDHFKKLNDELGHEAGDEGLRAFSKTIHDTVRDTDIVVRLGGEEIAVIVLGADQNDAPKIDTNISDRLGSQNVKGRSFTYSLGVDNSKTFSDLLKIAQSENPMTGLSDLLQFADTALYKAKESGRNQMRFAGD